MEYKIIASDLDGTLFDSNGQLSRENLMAISELAKGGVYFVPSTGRGFSEIPTTLKDNPHIRYYICSNGAVVFDKMGENHGMNCISKADVQFILDTLAPCACHLTVRHNGKIFADAAFQTEEWWQYYNVWEGHRAVVREYAVCLPDFKEYCRSADRVECICVCFHSNEDRAACKRQLQTNARLRIAEGADYNLEIMNASAGKGNALRDLARMLGVDIAHTIAIGDSDNDDSMIRAAGRGLAVSNAVDSLKAVADSVICSNDEHVVRYIISHF